jgi:hypothetical protein
MDQNCSEIVSDEELDQMLERAKEFDSFPRIVEAVYRPDDEFLLLRLSDGAPGC